MNTRRNKFLAGLAIAGGIALAAAPAVTIALPAAAQVTASAPAAPSGTHYWA